MPCLAAGQQALLCTQAGELAPNGTALCAAAGYVVSDDVTRCYSGGDAPVLDSCRAAAPLPPRRSPPAAPAKKAADKGTGKKRKKGAKVGRPCL